MVGLLPTMQVSRVPPKRVFNKKTLLTIFSLMVGLLPTMQVSRVPPKRVFNKKNPTNHFFSNGGTLTNHAS
uniref:Uncharacterized protein n=1 Tax=Anopheles atroparvus TaxID=41427 RepID=A0AAG5D1Z2_ANOAO